MSSENKYTLNIIRIKITKTLEKLIENDLVLIENSTNERSITHKLGEYLQEEFIGWNVDCEYNKLGHCPKVVNIPKNYLDEIINWDDTQAKTVYPDIIIHNRLTINNLLAIEAKKDNNRIGDDYDKIKLLSYMKNHDYGYKYGLFIKFHVNNPHKISLTWFENESELKTEVFYFGKSK